MALAYGAMLFAPATVQAQQWVRGVVAEVETGERIEGAAVLLIGADEAVVATALSDSAGRFELAVPEPGAYRLRVSRVGYRPVRSDLIDVPAEVAVETRAHLSPDALVLEAVTVVSEAPPRELERFARRRRQHRGYSFTRADFERLRAGHVKDLLPWVPGYTPRIDRSGGFTGIGLSLNFRRCSPAVYFDGREIRPWDVPYWIQDAPLFAVYGVEVFRTWSEVPEEFAAPRWSDSRCGVILIWTAWKMGR